LNVEATALSIIELILTTAPTDIALIQQVIGAVKGNDQASLDAARATALAAANAARPAGTPPLT
jgi:hypothetical protein